MTKVVDDSQWLEIEPDVHGDTFGTQDLYTFEELEQAVGEEYDGMSEEERSVRAEWGSPTYLHWTLGCSGKKLKPGQKIEVDEFNNRHRIVENER